MTLSKNVILQVGPMMALVRDQVSKRALVIDAPVPSGSGVIDASGITANIVLVTAPNKISPELIDALPNLELIASLGVGTEHIDLAHAASRGVIVTNTPDVLTEEVADLSIGLLISTIRQLPQADRFVREGRWQNGPFPLTGSLRNRHVGILGLGRIGKAIARRLEGFATKIGYHGRHEQPSIPYQYYPSLIKMAEAIDTLICVAPGGADTYHLIGKTIFEALGPNGIFINVGRGSVVDEAALIWALKNGIISGAGLDVYEKEPQVPHELIVLPQVVLLPHVGSASIITRNAMAQRAVDNVLHWIDSRAALDPVISKA